VAGTWWQVPEWCRRWESSGR